MARGPARNKRELEAIWAITEAVSTSLELNKVLETAMLRATQIVGADNSAIHLLEEATGDLLLRAHTGLPQSVLPQIERLPAGQPISILFTAEGKPVQVADMTSRPIAAVWRSKKGATRAVGLVPIRLPNQVLGLFSTARADDSPIAPRDLSLIQAIANAIAPAIERARLYEQEKKAAHALAQEKQLLEAVNAVVSAASSAVELDVALNLALDKALEVTGRKVGHIHLMDDATGELVLACQRNLSPAVAQEIQRIKPGESTIGLAAASAKPILVSDASTDPRVSRASKLEKPHSVASVPLMVHGQARGVMVIIRMKVGGLTERDLQILAAIANAVAPAIERARLYEQEKKAAHALAQEKQLLEAVNAVVSAASSAVELDVALNLALDKALEVTRQKVGYIHLVDDTTGELVLACHRNATPALVQGLQRIKAGTSAVGLVMAEARPILVTNVQTDPRITIHAPKQVKPHSAAFAPLMVHGKPRGVITIVKMMVGGLAEADLQVLTTIANAVAPAIERARLYEQEKKAAHALAQEKQLLEAVNAVVSAASSSLELNQVFKLALDKILEVADLRIGSVHIIDEANGDLVMAYSQGYSEKVKAELQRFKLEKSAAIMASAQGQAALITNTATDPRLGLLSLAGEPPASAVFAPLMVSGKVVGMIGGGRLGAGLTTDSDLKMMQAIANAIAPAIERARLIKQEQEDAQALAQEKKALEAVNSVVAAASASMELNLVLELALEKTISVLGTDAGSIHLLEEGSGDLVLKAHHRLPLEAVKDIQRLKVDNSMVGMAVLRNEPVLLPDIAQEPRLATQATIQQGPRTLAVVPIRLQDRVLGALATGRAGAGSISPHNTKLMRAIANAIAPAIEHARLYEQMKALALTDPLTGLHNMRYLQGELEREVARSRREHSRLSLLMMDVDSLKSVNDRYGHEVGSRLLKELGAIFSGALRASDIVARYGGDEFVVVLPGTDPGEAEIVARRLQQRVNAYRLKPKEGEEVPVSVSIGIATFPQQAATAGELIDRADSAVYRSKARGKNQITLYPEAPVPPNPGQPK